MAGSDTNSEYESGAPGPSTKKKLRTEIVHKKCVTTYSRQDFKPSETQSGRETAVKSCSQSPKEYGKRKRQGANKIPKTNAQRQQKFRQNQKNMRKSETLDSNLARKRNDAERSKRYRDRLKSKKQRGELDFVLSSKEHQLPTVLIENEEKTDQRHDTNCEELIFGQFIMQTNQIQPLMNDEARQVMTPSFQSFQAPYEEHDECSVPNAVLRHETNIAGDVSIRCKVCTKDVKDYEELKEHTDNCTRLKYSASEKCNKLPFKLKKDQLDCSICKKTFLNYVNLNTHMNVHYPDYICDNCGKAFASKTRLRGHMRTHEVGSFPCKYCEAVFDRSTKRENHVSKEHKAGVRYACKRCNISLTSFYARQKHLAEVHNEELKRYKCKECPQSYITPSHLSSHVRRDHLNERNHKCDKCDLAFYTKSQLKMHLIKHDGVRIHTCHVCQKSYQRKQALREHLRIHDNDKRFVCPVCGRAFTQKCALKRHIKIHERKMDLDVKRKVEDVIHHHVDAVRL